MKLVFVPVPGSGHLVSALEFAKRLINFNDQLSITILNLRTPWNTADEYIKSIITSQSRIQLIDLPQVDPIPVGQFKSVESRICALIESLIPHVRNTLTDIVSSDPNKVVGLVLDFFCVSMIDVANELGLPSYIFLTSNSGFLGFMLYLSDRHKQNNYEIKHSDPEMILPGGSILIPPNVLPSAVFDKEDGYTSYVKLAQRFRETKGIIVNSFAELEPYAAMSFSDKDKHIHAPPVYMVGPVIDLKGQPHPSLDQTQYDNMMNWLDEQPPTSVVFLCFGSMGRFEASQLREIANGLEDSGQRFLWAIRVSEPGQKPEEILPEGFIERIGKKGMVCEWAPQVQVLAHKAIGGFVSHCGWNSILESLWYEVPIATWPLYAEQRLNALRMVKELGGLAVEIKLDYSAGAELVTAEEIEIGLRKLMESDSEVRKKVKEMGEIARKALIKGGSSFAAVERLINDIIGSHSL